jgi:transposase
MRGDDGICGNFFSYIDLEKRVRADHPLRVIRAIANAALKSLSSDFGKLYSPIGRGSIPPERLMRAMLLQAFYSIRSERQLVERIDYDLLFRWFVGLGIEDAVWDATTFTKNRDRLLDGEVASKFLSAVLSQDQVKRLLSSDHFSVDGTLLEAWASLKSLRAKDGSGEPPGPGRNGEHNFHGERRTNDTHASTTDPDARLFRKGPGKEARLCSMGHALMENRNGLIIGAVTTRASGHAERLAALALIEPYAERPQPVTLGADKSLPPRRRGTTTPVILSSSCERRRSPRMLRRTRAAAVRRSMAAPPAMPATRSPNASANASRRPSAGPRRLRGCARCDIADCPRSIGNSPSPWPHTIWFACPNCSPNRWLELGSRALTTPRAARPSHSTAHRKQPPNPAPTTS